MNLKMSIVSEEVCVTRISFRPLIKRVSQFLLKKGNDASVCLKLQVRTMLLDDYLYWPGNGLKVCAHFFVLLQACSNYDKKIPRFVDNGTQITQSWS